MFNYLRNKTIANLVGLLILGLVVGALHNRELKTGRSLYVQDTVRSSLAPVDVAAHAVLSVGKVAVVSFRPRSVLLKENRQLRARVKRLARENARLQEAARENAVLRAALELRESSKMDMVSAEVVSRDQSNWFDTATISRGTKAGVERGSAVVNHLGLIGQVSDVDPFTSQVVALTNSDSAVSAMVQRSRAVGMLYGQGADYLVLAYLPKDSDVRVKDVVVSSGMGKVVPKGLVIGRVVKVVRNSTAGTTSALIRPSVRFDEVEQVFVVKLGQASAQ
ncbi:MAG: rod shape-determining protein MreC [Armatimonadota bacterium]|nr:rod shape-determining protein MreC [bacterium]